MVGGGGREHALIRKLKESPKVSAIYCAPGNAGISRDAVCYPVAATDIPGMVKLARELQADLVFVAPDDPLALGMVDALEAEGIAAFGPQKAAAEIEASKIFSKNLMQRYQIPTAGYAVFTDAQEALAYIQNQPLPLVIKADGLALGKGVIIAHTLQEAEEAVNSMMLHHQFGAAGDRVVVEEYLAGREVTVLAFTDGKTLCPMVSSMDHKPVFDGNQGPNTGGMGTISPNPYYDEKTAAQCMERIFLPTLRAMAEEGRPFKGCLYFGLILTADGPKVIEYNARFGDPEAQVVLPRLKTDLVTIIKAILEERLDTVSIEWKEDACACVMMASGGYPGKYQGGMPITGLDTQGQHEGVTVYHSGTKLDASGFVTAGGRVLGVSALGANLEDALEKAYAGVANIHFDGAHYRKDIGQVK